MINPYAVGFVCVAAVAVAGVDYFDQSRKAGMAVGQMGLMSYVDTIPQRFSAAKQEKRQAEAERERKAAWALGGVQFLPEAPEGWSRRALLEGDDSAIMPPESGSGAEDGVGQSLLEQMEAREKVKKTKKRAERSFVYERGTETVFVEVETRARPDSDSNSLVGLVGATLDGQDFGAFEDILGYDTIGGVAYTETLGDDGAREYHFRVLEGTIGFGHEVGLTVHANASRASTNEILAAIDYDGLNRLLPVPMPAVGNEVRPPEGTDGAALSMALYELRQEFRALRATEAQYRINNLDTRALLVNTYAQGYGGDGGTLDITGGQEVNLSTLIELGYRKAAASVIAGKSPADVKAEISRLVDLSVKLSDAETAAATARAAGAPEPEMSPELAAELGLAPDGDGVAQPREQSAHAEAGEAPDPGARLMRIDPEATKAAGGNVVSVAAQAEALARFKDALGASEVEMHDAMITLARAFESKHALPERSCNFVYPRHRLECDAAQSQKTKGIQRLIDSVIGTGEQEQAVRAEPAEKPRRLKLSNGGENRGSRCVGSFCD